MPSGSSDFAPVSTLRSPVSSLIRDRTDQTGIEWKPTRRVIDARTRSKRAWHVVSSAVRWTPARKHIIPRALHSRRPAGAWPTVLSVTKRRIRHADENGRWGNEFGTVRPDGQTCPGHRVVPGHRRGLGEGSGRSRRRSDPERTRRRQARQGGRCLAQGDRSERSRTGLRRDRSCGRALGDRRFRSECRCDRHPDQQCRNAASRRPRGISGRRLRTAAPDQYRLRLPCGPAT